MQESKTHMSIMSIKLHINHEISLHIKIKIFEPVVFIESCNKFFNKKYLNINLHI